MSKIYARIINNSGFTLKYITDNNKSGKVENISKTIEPSKTGSFVASNKSGAAPAPEGYVVYEVQDDHKDRFKLVFHDSISDGNPHHYVKNERDKYLGAIICGDLYNNDKEADSCVTYRDEFKRLYCQFPDGYPGAKRNNGLLIPIYEGVGNHCEYRKTSAGTSWDLVAKRNRDYEGRRWVDDICGTDYHYSWVWKGVRFYQLNLFPGNGEPKKKDGVEYAQNPQKSLTFLSKVLAKDKNKNMPTVLCFHYGMNTSSDNDKAWGPTERSAFGDVIHKYRDNIKAIFTGHSHQNKILQYNWEYKDHTYTCYGLGFGAYGKAGVFKINDDHTISYEGEVPTITV